MIISVFLYFYFLSGFTIVSGFVVIYSTYTTRLKKKEIAQLASIYSPICPSSLVTCSAFLTTGLVLKHGIIIKKPQVCPPCSIYSCSIYSCSIAALEYILIISSWWLLAFSIWWRFSRFPSHLFTHCPLGIGMS